MASERDAERADVRALQREKERERRRLRDRQRRQNMSQEQRERHLARRRRNYQLRRLRAQNAQLLPSQQSHLSMGAPPDPKMIKPSSSDCPQLELPVAPTTQDIQGAPKMRNSPNKLRLTDVKHLARRLHSDGQNQAGGDVTTNDITATISCASTKRLRLIHVKRLARSIKSNAK